MEKRICENCRIEINENDKYCNNCKFPITGDEKEKNIFYAQQTIQKEKIIKAFKKIKIARVIIFSLSILFILPALTNSNLFGINTLIHRFFLGLLFLGFGLYSLIKQKPAFLILLILSVVFYFFILYINDFKGTFESFSQVIIILFVSYGYIIAIITDKIFKRNKYLFDNLIKNNQEDRIKL